MKIINTAILTINFEYCNKIYKVALIHSVRATQTIRNMRDFIYDHFITGMNSEEMSARSDISGS